VISSTVILTRGTRWASAAFLLLTLALGLALEWVPNDADQGFSQRIFYLHVPVALTAYVCFGVGAWKALRLLQTGREGYDVESAVAVHIGTIFGALTLLTGSIWARISWGVWWTWSENQLVLFLVIFLFYSAYFMLRQSVPPGIARARLSAVFALLGVILIPISFLAIRLAANFIHPVVFTQRGPQMAPSMMLVFFLSLAGMLALAFTLYAFEVRAKLLDRRMRELREVIA
jgi:heme exporter protein C